MGETQQLALLGMCKSIRKHAFGILKKYDNYNTDLVNAVYDREKDLLQTLPFPSETERDIQHNIKNIFYEVKAIASSFDDVVVEAKKIGIIMNFKMLILF